MEIYVYVAWLVYNLGWEDCSRIRKCPEMYSNRAVCVEAEPASEMEKYGERRRIWFQQDGEVCMTRSETKRDQARPKQDQSETKARNQG